MNYVIDTKEPTYMNFNGTFEIPFLLSIILIKGMNWEVRKDLLDSEFSSFGYGKFPPVSEVCDQMFRKPLHSFKDNGHMSFLSSFG